MVVSSRGSATNKINDRLFTKVRLIRESGSEEIEFRGNIIVPWYINVLSITIKKDVIEFYLLSSYTTKISPDLDNQKLWIMGKDIKPLSEDAENEPPRIM